MHLQNSRYHYFLLSIFLRRHYSFSIPVQTLFFHLVEQDFFLLVSSKTYLRLVQVVFSYNRYGFISFYNTTMFIYNKAIIPIIFVSVSCTDCCYSFAIRGIRYMICANNNISSFGDIVWIFKFRLKNNLTIFNDRLATFRDINAIPWLNLLCSYSKIY